MPFLTDTEKVQITDHLGWDNAEIQSQYVNTVLNPRLEADFSAAKLELVREHLGRLNKTYGQLDEAAEDFGLDEAGGVKFSRVAEGRLGGMYAFWQGKLAKALNLKINTEQTETSGISSGRIILDS